MTKKFDDDARERYNHFNKDHLAYLSGHVRDMWIEEVTAKYARPYIAANHYTKTFPDSTKYTFAGFIEGKLAGIITYGMGVGLNQYTSLLPDLQKGEYLELTRLWSPDGFPKNTESKLIAESRKLLPSNVRLIMSFADGSRGHVGTIYQASNFHYCGLSAGGKMLVTEDGIEKHPRLLGIYRMRHPEYRDMSTPDLMKLLKYKYIPAAQKYRYVLLVGNKEQKHRDLETIKDKIQPYPKLVSEIC